MENQNINVDEKEIKFEQPNFLSFLVGVRGDQLYECKTNIQECTVADYIEASAAIDMNITLLLLQTGGIQAVETFFKMKEILSLNSVRLMGTNPEEYGLTPEEYTQLRDFFNIDAIEQLIKDKKDEMIHPEENNDVKPEIELNL